MPTEKDRSTVWTVRAAELRVMAARSEEAERERKLLMLADRFEETARRADNGSDRRMPSAPLS
jgi:hypothetical protein